MVASLVTALLESIDIFIAVFNAHDNLIRPGQAYKHVRVKSL